MRKNQRRSHCRERQCIAILLLLFASISSAFGPSQPLFNSKQLRSPSLLRRQYSTNPTNPTNDTQQIIQLPQEDLHHDIEQLMSQHDPILLFVSRLLPAPIALDAAALYAWCRRLDEITDDPEADVAQVRLALQEWQHRFDKLWNGEPTDAMDAALYACLQRHPGELGRAPFCDMMAGMRADAMLDRRVSDMAELEGYAYQVAGTVGLMLLPLLEANVTIARDPAISLGKAIQLINILRDATPDAQLGRIYLPQDMLQAHGVHDSDIFALNPSHGYRTVVKLVADRAKELLLDAESGRSTLPGLGPLLVQIIIELYRGYLEQLEKLEYNNLLEGGERVRISTARKLAASIKALGTLLSTAGR